MGAGWQNDRGNSYMNADSAATHYPTDLGGATGGASATSTDSVFENVKFGTLFSVMSGGGNVSVEDHDGNPIMTLVSAATVPANWTGAIKLTNGLRIVVTAGIHTVEYAHGGQGNA